MSDSVEGLGVGEGLGPGPVTAASLVTYAGWEAEDPGLYTDFLPRVAATLAAAAYLDEHSHVAAAFPAYEKLARPLTVEWMRERRDRQFLEAGRDLADLLGERSSVVADCGCGLWLGLASCDEASESVVGVEG